jgi:hypothetical protein
VQGRHEAQREHHRRLRVGRQRQPYLVLGHPLLAAADILQQLALDVAVLGQADDFIVADARVLQHEPLHQPIRVAQQEHAGIAIALERQLEALADAHGLNFGLQVPARRRCRRMLLQELGGNDDVVSSLLDDFGQRVQIFVVRHQCCCAAFRSSASLITFSARCAGSSS